MPPNVANAATLTKVDEFCGPSPIPSSRMRPPAPVVPFTSPLLDVIETVAPTMGSPVVSSSTRTFADAEQRATRASTSSGLGSAPTRIEAVRVQ